MKNNIIHAICRTTLITKNEYECNCCSNINKTLIHIIFLYPFNSVQPNDYYDSYKLCTTCFSILELISNFYKVVNPKNNAIQKEFQGIAQENRLRKFIGEKPITMKGGRIYYYD